MTTQHNQNPKILILHGWGQDKTVWQSFIQDIGPDRAIAIDLPGFGAEPLVQDDWGVPEYANWVEQKVTEMNLDNLILLGHSFGGRISSLIASKRPNWLKGLILIGAPCIYRPSWKIKLRIKLYKVAKKILPAYIRHKIFGTPDLKSADGRGLHKIFRKAVPFDQTNELTQIAVPTLILWGELDEEAPLHVGQEMHQLIKNSKLEVFPGIGHQVVQQALYLAYGIIKKYVENL